MKSTFAVFVAFLLAVPTITKAGITVDGTVDSDYQSPIVTQQLGTSTYKNTETNIDAAGGSELDAAYGTISNGVLYLVLAGNMDSGGTDSLENPYDKLHIFFMTGPGGDHTLGTNYNVAADSGQINLMGVDGGSQQDGNPGLTFDTGFAPNYWLGVTIGPAGVAPTMYVNYEVICSNCFGAYLGNVSPGLGQTNNIFVDSMGFGIRAALNNSNTNGVQMDTSGCYVNGAPFNPQNVKTGLELAIPLSAIGSPTGQVSICAFFTDEHYASMYNQVLAPINGGTLECQGSFGSVDAVDFSTLPGTHTFTFTVAPCEVLQIQPTSASYGSSVATGTISVVESGSCGWTAASGSPFITIVSGASGSGSGTITYAVGTNTTIDARTGTINIAGLYATQAVNIAQSGTSLPPLSSIIVDGIAESAYGCPLAVQQLATGYGNNVNTNLMSNAGGSELDAAYGLVKDGVLFLVFSGNLENNFNKVNVFFMTGPGGENTLTNVNPGVDSGGLNNMGATTNGTGPGLTFDVGFAPNYWMSLTGGGTPYRFYANYAQLWPGGTNSSGLATNGYFLGSTGTTNGTLSTGSNPFLIQATINDTNTNGVPGGTCNTNVYAAGFGPGDVRTGIELAIPLGALGSPTGSIAVCAFVGSGSYQQMSNQILPPIAASTNLCQGNLSGTNTPAINLGTFPGQHFFLVGPEMRVTSIGVANKNVNISYQTENNTNLLYRVERTLGNLSTNSVWTPISAFTPGTGGIISQTDTLGGTNKPDALYRIRQSPQCQP